jgi:hypothetical protein
MSILLEMDIKELYKQDKEVVLGTLKVCTKEDLIAFAEKHGIAVKTYHSRPSIARHLAQEIASTGIYRRISGADEKQSFYAVQIFLDSLNGVKLEKYISGIDGLFKNVVEMEKDGIIGNLYELRYVTEGRLSAIKDICEEIALKVNYDTGFNAVPH